MKGGENIMDISFIPDFDTEEERSSALPNPIDYYFYKGLREGSVTLNDDVDDELVEKVIFPLMQMDVDPSIEHITFYINSSGGDPQDGMAVVNCLENMKTPVTICILGRAASAAGYIAMAKGPHIKTVCGKYSVCLIHAGSVFIYGNANEAEDTHDFIKRYDEDILKKFVISHTKITEKKYAEIKRREYWLLAEDMLKYGIVDEIV